MTRLTLLTSLLTLASFPSLGAGQSLDIGGIEIRLGQTASDVLRNLGSYRVVYSEAVQSWFVSQDAGKVQVLGNFGARNGVVDFISKSFPITDPSDFPAIYTRAADEAKRRGGSTCTLLAAKRTDNLIHSFDMRCGSYTLSYFFPVRDDSGMVLGGDLSIMLGRRW